jgi:TRAP-type mannitol/chloroaromatic compound transport system permease small subunit
MPGQELVQKAETAEIVGKYKVLDVLLTIILFLPFLIYVVYVVIKILSKRFASSMKVKINA